jgi:enediyne biosynthesis protein E4
MTRLDRRHFMKHVAAAMSAAAIYLAFLLATSASTAAFDGPAGARLIKPGDAKSTIEFRDVVATSKIDFTLRNSISPQRYSIETMAGGVALFDYNNDGLLDIFFTNCAKIPSLEKTGPDFYNRLFHNNGDSTFTDVTEKAGLRGVGYTMGAAAGDYDNDGFVDLYVAGVNANQLYHNNGDGTFSDVTDKAGVGGQIPGFGKAWSVAAGWGDYNDDGHLDLLVINYLNYNIKTAVLCHDRGYPAYCSPNDFQGTPNILYRNNGDGTFRDVSAESHISKYIGKGMGVAFADYDDDGFTDFFVSNDTFPNFLLRNNRDGTFTDVALEAGVAYTGDGKTVAGMGVDFRDLDNDGKPDIFHTAMFGDTFPLYRNLGGGEFEDRTGPSGLTALTSRFTAWGTGGFDFDNDGQKDLFIATGEILDNADEAAHRPAKLPDLLLRNKGNLTFDDVSRQAGSVFSVAALHRGAAFGDLNNDGKIDIVVSALNAHPQLLLNSSRNHNHWIILKLVGMKSNRDGLGTKVKITTANGAQYNHATTAVSYNSSSDKRIHFGLGDATMIDKIELTWPSGTKQVLANVKADQILTVIESHN